MKATVRKRKARRAAYFVSADKRTPKQQRLAEEYTRLRAEAISRKYEN